MANYQKCDNCGISIKDCDVNNAVYEKLSKRPERESVYCTRKCCIEDNRRK